MALFAGIYLSSFLYGFFAPKYVIFFQEIYIFDCIVLLLNLSKASGSLDCVLHFFLPLVCFLCTFYIMKVLELLINYHKY